MATAARTGAPMQRSFWPARSLRVHYRITNTGGDIVYNPSITGSTATNSVILETTTPVSLGASLAGGAAVDTTLKYHVLDGVGSFRATVLAQAQDACGTGYTYP